MVKFKELPDIEIRPESTDGEPVALVKNNVAPSIETSCKLFPGA